MGQLQSPSPEELRFVYRLLLKGYTDADIVREYDNLERAGKLGNLPARSATRSIRQRRKEFEASKEVLSESLKGSVTPPGISQTWMETYQAGHNGQLPPLPDYLLPFVDRATYALGQPISKSMKLNSAGAYFPDNMSRLAENQVRLEQLCELVEWLGSNFRDWASPAGITSIDWGTAQDCRECASKLVGHYNERRQRLADHRPAGFIWKR